MPTAKNNQVRYKRTSLVSEKIDDKEIVLNHQKGTIVRLNITASEILSSLKSPKTFTQITKILGKKYASVSSKDIRSSIEKMIQAGLMRTVSKLK